MGIENLLNPAEEEEDIEIITTESQLEFIIGNSGGAKGDTWDDDDNEVYTSAEELNARGIAASVVER